MALPATMRRFAVEVADSDRGHYATLDLRVAQHPSESPRYLAARVLARALEDAEGLEFTRGLSVDDEPALWQRDLRGDPRAWIEVGAPSSARIHRAQKAWPRVVVYGWRPGAKVALEFAEVYAAERLEIIELPPAELDALAATLDRQNTWSVSVAGGIAYVEANGTQVALPIERFSAG